MVMKLSVSMVIKKYTYNIRNVIFSPRYSRFFNNNDVRFREDGYIADVYNTSAKMSTYLLAFVVCDFGYVENKTKTGVKVIDEAHHIHVFTRHKLINDPFYYSYN